MLKGLTSGSVQFGLGDERVDRFGLDEDHARVRTAPRSAARRQRRKLPERRRGGRRGDSDRNHEAR